MNELLPQHPHHHTTTPHHHIQTHKLRRFDTNTLLTVLRLPASVIDSTSAHSTRKSLGMSDRAVTFPLQIPFVSQLPAQDEEMKCLAVLMHNKPFRSPSDMAALKAECGSWKAAHEVFTNELKAKYLDSNKTDQHSYNVLHAMHRMMNSTSESVKEEYLQLKKLQNLEIVSLDWPSLCALADPEMMAAAGMGEGMKSCCWHCGKRPEEGKCLLKCGKCEKASYCSKECQVSSWWHHKRTKKNDLSCSKEE